MLPTIIGIALGFVPVVIIIIVLSVLYHGVDPQDGVRYDTEHIHCKALVRKLPYCDSDIRYLITYMDLILPLMSAYTLYHLVLSIIGDDIISFFVLSAIVVVQILSVILMRGIDSAGFAINIAAILGTGAVFIYINLPISLLWVINLLIGAWYIGYHVKYFYDRRDIFCKTVKELRKEYE